MGTYRTKNSFTPGEAVCMIGEDTYGIKVGPGHFRERHESAWRGGVQGALARLWAVP